jgi:hypothetical protein
LNGHVFVMLVEQGSGAPTSCYPDRKTYADVPKTKTTMSAGASGISSNICVSPSACNFLYSHCLPGWVIPLVSFEDPDMVGKRHIVRIFCTDPFRIASSMSIVYPLKSSDNDLYFCEQSVRERRDAVDYGVKHIFTRNVDTRYAKDDMDSVTIESIIQKERATDSNKAMALQRAKLFDVSDLVCQNTPGSWKRVVDGINKVKYCMSKNEGDASVLDILTPELVKKCEDMEATLKHNENDDSDDVITVTRKSDDDAYGSGVNLKTLRDEVNARKTRAVKYDNAISALISMSDASDDELEKIESQVMNDSVESSMEAAAAMAMNYSHYPATTCREQEQNQELLNDIDAAGFMRDRTASRSAAAHVGVSLEEIEDGDSFNSSIVATRMHDDDDDEEEEEQPDNSMASNHLGPKVVDEDVGDYNSDDSDNEDSDNEDSDNEDSDTENAVLHPNSRAKSRIIDSEDDEDDEHVERPHTQEIPRPTERKKQARRSKPRSGNAVLDLFDAQADGEEGNDSESDDNDETGSLDDFIVNTDDEEEEEDDNNEEREEGEEEEEEEEEQKKDEEMETSHRRNESQKSKGSVDEEYDEEFMNMMNSF